MVASLKLSKKNESSSTILRGWHPCRVQGRSLAVGVAIALMCLSQFRNFAQTNSVSNNNNNNIDPTTITGSTGSYTIVDGTAIPTTTTTTTSAATTGTSSVDLVSNFTRLLNDNITDPWKRELYERLDKLRMTCGVLCSINDEQAFRQHSTPQRPGNKFATLQATNVDCDALFQSTEIDAGDISVPYPPPVELLPYYSMNGLVHVRVARRYRNIYLGGDAMTTQWTHEMIEELKRGAIAGNMKATYGSKTASSLRNVLHTTMNLTSKHVLVVGSERPWVEATALSVGAATVTTLEYGKIQSEHDQIITYTPHEFRQAYLNRTLRQFDAVLTFSSVEHSGLGRYGDALNPWGDILAVARCWCTTKDNGLLMVGVPAGPDAIQFNGHRIYGNIRWPLLTINWEPIDGTTDFTVGEGARGGTPHIFRKISVSV